MLQPVPNRMFVDRRGYEVLCLRLASYSCSYQSTNASPTPYPAYACSADAAHPSAANTTHPSTADRYLCRLQHM